MWKFNNCFENNPMSINEYNTQLTCCLFYTCKIRFAFFLIIHNLTIGNDVFTSTYLNFSITPFVMPATAIIYWGEYYGRANQFA